MEKSKLVFQRINYIIMLIGIAILLVGFYVMTLDKEPYGFGSLGLTIGPLILLVGFITEFFAILYKPKKNNEHN